MTNTTLSLTQARKELFTLTGKVQNPGIAYTFTEKGRPTSVLMSFDEYTSWSETLDVLQENPNITKHLEKAEKNIAAGKTTTLETMKKKYGI